MSYVYFILDKISNAVKIGKANDVLDRLSTLQTGNPNKLILLGYIECISEKYSFLIEKQYHQKFKDLHLNGEWFRYDEKIFQNLLLNESNIKTKSKRQPLTINTLWGEEVVRDVVTHPRCYFYSELVAQIKENYEKSLNLKLPFRTMRYPTNGKKMLLPYSTEVNRVFISARKHNENRKQKEFEKQLI
jgi:hypothetical protein